ncbi:MAG: SRPBCC domain-containing protein [Micropruina sp.]|nr:MAG: SRPBCC domain-containing protein [Micropruina sp.]
MSSATGTIVQHAHGPHLALARCIKAPLDDVWTALTDPARLAGWIGVWHGDPASGRVDFRMTYEGDGPATPMVIEVCQAPTRLRVTSDTGDAAFDWTLDLRLSHRGCTELSLWQPLSEGVDVAAVGPGWDYYLDRLVAYLDAGDATSVVWSDYEGLAEEYQAIVPTEG